MEENCRMPLHHSFRLIAPALIAGLMAVPGVASAQTTEPAPPPAGEEQAQQPAEATAPSQQQLESFAAATVQIAQIQEEAQKRMQAAVEEEGLTIEQYNEIAQAAKADPQIEQTLQTMIRDRLGG
jgi:hypothetical protein